MPDDDLPVRGSLVLPARELHWRFSRSSGPGGQGVNTADSRVELSFDLAGSPSFPVHLREDGLIHRCHRLYRLMPAGQLAELGGSAGRVGLGAAVELQQDAGEMCRSSVCCQPSTIDQQWPTPPVPGADGRFTASRSGFTGFVPVTWSSSVKASGLNSGGDHRRGARRSGPRRPPGVEDPEQAMTNPT